MEDGAQGQETLEALPDVETLIRIVRGQRVMLDCDLAVLYGVETGALVRAIHRNAARFPEDFMFQLTKDEAETFEIPNWHLKSGRVEGDGGISRMCLLNKESPCCRPY
jgi:hypothetical protein